MRIDQNDDYLKEQIHSTSNMEAGNSPIRAAVYLAVAKMVEERVSQVPGGVTATPAFVAMLVDLVINQLMVLGQDLEAFAHHANRDVIEPSDMYLATRKNESLTNVLKQVEKSLGGGKN